VAQCNVLKYACTVKGLSETQGVFEGLSASVSASQMQIGGAQYEEAMVKRGEFLRIFEVKESLYFTLSHIRFGVHIDNMEST
jgi:hypothetical protein